MRYESNAIQHCRKMKEDRAYFLSAMKDKLIGESYNFTSDQIAWLVEEFGETWWKSHFKTQRVASPTHRELTGVNCGKFSFR